MTVPEAAAPDVPGPDVRVSEAQGPDAEGSEAQGPDAEGSEAHEAGLRLRRGRLITSVVAAALVLVVGAVALLGGFSQRKDLFTPVPVGSLITTGLLEVTIEKATVRRESFDDGWRVEVSGMARTTGDTSIAPETDGSGFVFARSASTREVQPSKYVGLGTADVSTQLGFLAPGLPAVPWTLDFTFTQPPGDELLVVVFEQEYTTPWIFGTDMGWRPGRHGSTLTLPVEQAPNP